LSFFSLSLHYFITRAFTLLFTFLPSFLLLLLHFQILHDITPFHLRHFFISLFISFPISLRHFFITPPAPFFFFRLRRYAFLLAVFFSFRSVPLRFQITLASGFHATMPLSAIIDIFASIIFAISYYADDAIAAIERHAARRHAVMSAA